MSEAGRELDAEVAEKVFGFCFAVGGRDVQVGDDGDVWPNGERRWYFTDDLTRPIISRAMVPPYSTDIAAAWEVVERTRKITRSFNGDFSLGEDLRPCRGPYYCRFAGGLGYAEAPTIPEAICRAALLSVAFLGEKSVP